MKTLKAKLNKTIELASKSNHRKFKICAILWYKGKPLGVGWNINCKEFSPQSFVKRKGGIHAEGIAIIIANQKGVKLKESILTIARVGKKGEIREAKPCKNCKGLIEKIGIKKVYWTEGKESKLC